MAPGWRSRLWGALLLPLLGQAAGGPAAGGPAEPRPPPPPFDALFARGVEACDGGDYAGAARWLERALSGHRQLREARLRCGLGCGRREPLARLGPGAGGDLPFFGSVLRRARCLRRCQGRRLGAASRHRASEEVRADFQRRVPYSYLQRAYTQASLTIESSCRRFSGQ
ncbi:prolyl 3-hydroxylase 2 [Macrochelys suwanniensis]